MLHDPGLYGGHEGSNATGERLQGALAGEDATTAALAAKGAAGGRDDVAKCNELLRMGRKTSDRGPN